MAILPVGLSAEAGGYQIERSLRFNSADTASLTRSFGTPTDNQKWTMSAWVKRGKLTADYYTLFGRYADGNNFMRVDFLDDTFRIYQYQSANKILLKSTQVLRDTAAWYHLMVVLDLANGTSSNRVKLYVNGSQITSFSTATYPASTDSSVWNVSGGASHYLGGLASGEFDGYLTEVHFIDGSALTPSSFGETDTDTGVWKPKAYSGSYGTNGFYLDFGDNSSTTALGYDAAGSNDWTPNNFSVTAGAGNDSLVDSPTRYGTDTGVGGEVRGNYATLNPLSKSSYISLANGNLDSSGNTSADEGVCGSTIAVKTGKWYAEFTVTGSIVSNRPNYGIIPNAGKNFTNGGGDFAVTAGMRYGPDGKVYTAGSLFGTFSTFTTGDVIGVAIDSDNGAAYVSKNGTWQNSGVPTSGASKTGAVVTWTGGSVEHFFAIDEYNGSTSASNFGQRPFVYTAPSGFKALCTTNLPEPTIAEGKDYFDALIYTGDGTSNRSLTGLNFQPDFVWNKARSNAYGHKLYDAVRGVTKQLNSHTTNAEATTGTDLLVSFDSNGITIGNDTGFNGSGATFVDWCWKANGAGSSNTAGTISSTVSANTTAGFSIVTYTGTGSNATVGHGLGAAPSMAIIKRRSTSGSNWLVYHKSLTATSALYLNTTEAKQTFSDIWNNTEPTSTVMSLGTTDNCNLNGGTYVGYFFAPIAGYSAFGSYTGNGSTDGPFVFTGFRPRYVMIKNYTSAGNGWILIDTARSTYNQTALQLYANSSAAEASSSAYLDIVSNGFKTKSGNSDINDSAVGYIYAAFAENPFKYSLAR